MSITFRSLLAALVAITCAATLVRADDKDDIKAAGKAFGDAMHASDIATARKHVVTSEATDKFLDMLADVITAKKKLTDAAVAKFGDDGKSISNQSHSPIGSTATSRDFDDADIEVTGDTALVTPKTGNTRPVSFKKDGGEWKVDFTELVNSPKVARALPLMGKVATAMTETATEIGDGKYENVEAAKVGLNQKIIAAIRSGVPGGQPPAPPSN
jgi:hypothetical protein